MKAGLLWFDNTKGKPLAEKIEVAAARYQEKFGVPPNRAFVNPDDLPTLEREIEGITVEAKITILKNNVWLGVEDALPYWDGAPICPRCGYETDAGHCIVCDPRDAIELNVTEPFRAHLLSEPMETANENE